MTRQEAFICLESVPRRTVASVARGTGPTATALYTLARGDQCNWTLPEWKALLARLDADTSLVQEYIAQA